MGDITRGLISVGAVKRGTTDVVKVYRGQSLIWQVSSYDPDAEAFITATGISGTDANAINQLVLDLKAASIWTKVWAMYPFVGGTATTHKYNLMDPADTNAAYRLSFIGGWTHNSNGITGNGTNTYADTFINTTTLTPTTVSAGVYNRTGQGNQIQDYGTADGGSSTNDSWTMLTSRSNGNSLSDNWRPVQRAEGAGVGAAFYQMSRTSTTSHKMYRNTTTLSTYAGTVSPTYTTPNMTIGAQQRPGGLFPDGYSNKNYGLVYFGDGLTDGEITSMYNAVQTYQTTLGRQV